MVNKPSDQVGRMISERMATLGPDAFQLLRRNYGENKKLLLFRYHDSLFGGNFYANCRTRVHNYMTKLPCAKRVPWTYLTFNPEADIEGIAYLKMVLCKPNYEMMEVTDEEISSHLKESRAYRESKASEENAKKMVLELEKNGTRDKIAIKIETDETIEIEFSSISVVSTKNTILTIFRRYFSQVKNHNEPDKGLLFVLNKKSGLPGVDVVLQWLKSSSPQQSDVQ